MCGTRIQSQLDGDRSRCVQGLPGCEVDFSATTVSYALKTAFEASISWSKQYDVSDADMSRMSQPCTVSACFKLGQVDTA